MSFFFSSTPGPETRPLTPSRASGTRLYFAYGSNLHVAQMAQRCPESVFLGKAILPGYRWQINQRGVANVLPAPSDSVQGLIYLVNPKDERSLDRSEGVSRGLYQRHMLPVIFEPHRQFSNFKSSQLARLLESRQQPVLEDQDTPTSPWARVMPQRPVINEQDVAALVYVAENYSANGPIREEYIVRMRRAISDAVALGVSQSFTAQVIAPHLAGQIAEPLGALSALQRSITSGEDINAGSLDTPRTDPQPSRNRNRDPAHSNFVGIRKLKADNRKLHANSGMQFPAEMLSALAEVGPGHTVRDRDTKVYLVLIREDKADAKPVFKVEATTQDLELANELTMAKFRYLWDRDFSNSRTGSIHEGVRSMGDGGRNDSLEWSLDSNRCLYIHAAIPGPESRATVWVEMQVALTRS